MPVDEVGVEEPQRAAGHQVSQTLLGLRGPAFGMGQPGPGLGQTPLGFATGPVVIGRDDAFPVRQSGGRGRGSGRQTPFGFREPGFRLGKLALGLLADGDLAVQLGGERLGGRRAAFGGWHGPGRIDATGRGLVNTGRPG